MQPLRYVLHADMRAGAVRWLLRVKTDAVVLHGYQVASGIARLGGYPDGFALRTFCDPVLYRILDYLLQCQHRQAKFCFFYLELYVDALSEAQLFKREIVLRMLKLALELHAFFSVSESKFVRRYDEKSSTA